MTFASPTAPLRALTAFAALAFALLAASGARADDNPLARYVADADNAHAWEVRAEGEVGDGSRYVELLLTSQTWRGIAWRHQLYIIKPGTLAEGASQGLLMIDSGRWEPALAEPPGDDEPLPRNADLFIGLAEHLGTPVAVLRQVPFQPLFDGLTEDRLIAHTFEQFLQTGEDDWPLLLPMVNSAVRAMDTIQAHAAEAWDLQLESFTLTGASKRGWTTWLTAAVDPRVSALAPMVIDMLNTAEHLDHARASWGEHSDSISPYTDLALHERLDSARGQRLLDAVDPFRHRERLTQPKLIILGTNDEYWPVDALNLYWDGLQGNNRVLYVPNNSHRLDDYERVVAGVIALHQEAAGESPMPELSWRHEQDADGLTLHVHSDPSPDTVRLWTAQSDSRDLRAAHWSAVELEVSNGRASHRVDAPATRHRAVFAEVEYSTDREVPLFLSTTLRVLEPNGTER